MSAAGEVLQQAWVLRRSLSADQIPLPDKLAGARLSTLPETINGRWRIIRREGSKKRTPSNNEPSLQAFCVLRTRGMRVGRVSGRGGSSSIADAAQLP